MLLVALIVSSLSLSLSQSCFEPPLPVDISQPPPALQTALDQLAANISAAVKQYNTASFYATLVVNQNTVWSQGWGVRNKSENPPVTPNGDTVYRVGSVTKAFTVMEVLMLRDKGLLRLDDSINTLLPEFSIPNPWKSALNRPVTLRQLMGQVSGLVRVTPCESFTTGQCPEDTPTILSRVANEYTASPIQSSPSYSNVAYGLLGRGMEKIFGGVKWESTLQTQILVPLNMTRTWPDYSTEMLPNYAVGYLTNSNEQASYVSLGWENPTGGMYSSANDMGRFLKFLWNYDNYSGANLLLDPQTLREWFQAGYMDNDLVHGMSIPWEPRRYGNYTIFLKSGDIDGYSCYIGFIPEIKTGFTLMQSDASGTMQDTLTNIGNLIVNTVDPVMRSLQPAPIYPSGGPNQYVGIYSGFWGIYDMTFNVSVQLIAGYQRLTLDGSPDMGTLVELIYLPQADADVMWPDQRNIPHPCIDDQAGNLMPVSFIRNGSVVIGLQIPGLYWGMTAMKQ